MSVIEVNEINMVVDDFLNVPDGVEATEVVDPNGFILNVLIRSVANKQNIEISLSRNEKIALFPNHGEYFSQLNDEKAFYSAKAKDYRVTCFNPDQIEVYRRQGMHGRNIDEAFWKAGIYLSKGRLIKPCRREDVIELIHWPNLTRLPATPNTMAMAAFFSRHPTTITLASRLLKISLPELFTFYSAAYSAGWVIIHNHKPEVPKLKPFKNKAFLSGLLSRISGL